MPISKTFESRLLRALPGALLRHETPFYVYDERGIRTTAQVMARAFSNMSHRQYFAVKALPNPAILQILREEGQGFDCSSIAELLLAAVVDTAGEDIFFTSNNTSSGELALALEAGAIINLDDQIYLDQLPKPPGIVSFRVNPGECARPCNTIGHLRESKFGIPTPMLADAYRAAKKNGVARFGLHAMLSSNELDAQTAFRNAEALVGIAADLEQACGIRLEFINLGGGLGIPYRPGQTEFDIKTYAQMVESLMRATFGERASGIKVMTECGRYVTGPHGVLVTKVITRARKWKDYLGVDASMSALMRPGLYADAYHHITAPMSSTGIEHKFDVVGSLCENMDKFAVDRMLPDVDVGEILFIHDAGAHGHAMGFNYNGRTRPKELLLTIGDSLTEIRRREDVVRDYFATLPDVYQRKAAQLIQESSFVGGNLRVAN